MAAPDQAVALLSQAFSEGLSHGIHLHTDHWLRPLRSTPDFADLMRPKG